MPLDQFKSLGGPIMSNHSASFGTTNAKQFLEKLHDEQKDFVASNCLSERHALNAIITAYHLHEWVWGEWLQKRQDLRKEWGVNSSGEFGRRLANQYCPALEEARKIANGTKHFENRIVTGHHRGVFQRGVFQKDSFDVSRLWIDRGDKSQLAEDFIDELVKFWDQFFAQYEIG
jgi:hypothetical protein